MPILKIYVDARTMDILTEYGARHGRTVEELASSAVAEEAMRALPPHLRSYRRQDEINDNSGRVFAPMLR